MKRLLMVLAFVAAAAQAAASDMVGKVGENGEFEVRLQDRPCSEEIIQMHGVPAFGKGMLKGGTVDSIPGAAKLEICWMDYNEDSYFVFDAVGGFGTVPKAVFGANGV